MFRGAMRGEISRPALGVFSAVSLRFFLSLLSARPLAQDPASSGVPQGGNTWRDDGEFRRACLWFFFALFVALFSPGGRGSLGTNPVGGLVGFSRVSFCLVLCFLSVLSSLLGSGVVSGPRGVKMRRS